MPVIKLPPDRLGEVGRRFSRSRLNAPLFLNSLPKSGSHLLRNIIRMFVPEEQQYDVQFIQWANLNQHLIAFDTVNNYLSWGHLLFSDASAIELSRTHKILLVRDPYSWIIARARFFMSDEFSGNLDQMKDGSLGVDDIFNLMIFGIHNKIPSMAEIYTHNAIAWLGTSIHLVRYEDIVHYLREIDSSGAEIFFTDLLIACGIKPIPGDWRDRVIAGSDRKYSATARENLNGIRVDFPQELPLVQKRLVDFAAPGLRSLLGYEQFKLLLPNMADQ